VGFLDRAKELTDKAVDRHGDKIAKGIAKAGETINKRTGGKYEDTITSAERKIEDTLGKRGDTDGPVA
jgi:MT0933-like antitoxin protein